MRTKIWASIRTSLKLQMEKAGVKASAFCYNQKRKSECDNARKLGARGNCLKTVNTTAVCIPEKHQSFNFYKNKQLGVHPVHIGDKLLSEGVVHTKKSI